MNTRVFTAADLARRAVTVALEPGADRREQATALSSLHDSLGEAAMMIGAPRDVRVEALARSLAILIHTSSAGEAETARIAAEAIGALTFSLEILARAKSPRAAEIALDQRFH